MPQNNWTRDELIVAFNLYCRTPFGKIDGRNPEIIALAHAIGRTPGAVGLKLANFASLDPVHQARGISGMGHGSKGDTLIWNEFHADWEQLAYESERLLAQLEHKPLPEVLTPEEAVTIPPGKERDALVKVRVNQSFFRRTVLAAYDFRCAISGLAVPELLNASHIVPWSKSEQERTNPSNGLCLNAVLDRAFDRGFMTVLPDLTIQVSKNVTVKECGEAAAPLLLQYNGKIMETPRRFAPAPALLEWHNAEVFRG